MRKKKFISIKSTIITICICFSVIPLIIVSLFSTNVSTNALNQTAQQLSLEVIKQMASNVGVFIEQVEDNLTEFVVENTLTTSTFSDFHSKDAYTSLQANNQILANLNTFLSINQSVENAWYVAKNGAVMGTLEEVGYTKEQILAVQGYDVGTRATWIADFEGLNDKVFIARKLTGGDISGDIILMEINIEQMTGPVESAELLTGSTIAVLDSNKHLIYSKVEGMEEVAEDTSEETSVVPEEGVEVTETEGPVGEAIWEHITTAETVEPFRNADQIVTYSPMTNGWVLVEIIPEAALVEEISIVNRMVWLLIGLTIVSTVIVGTRIAKNFSDPILELIATMKKAEEGNLTVEAHTIKNNEIKLLCDSFNHMIGNMHHLLNETKEVVHDTLQSSELLVKSTQKTVNGFTQLTTSVAEIAAGATSQAMDTQDGVRAMSELGSSIEEVSETTETMHYNTQGVRTLLTEASGAMTELTTTTESAVKISSEVDDSVKALSGLNKDIEKMMAILNGISQETNLLAFNASIEAARAGEVGKGFAVVANEVRKLSEESKVSTDNVASILKQIENKTKNTANLMVKANDIFDEQSKAVQQTSSIMNKIVDMLHKVDTAIGQISVRVEDMNALRATTSDKIENIAAVIQESTASTEEVSSFSEDQTRVIGELASLCHDLVGAMQKLEQSIQRFEL